MHTESKINSFLHGKPLNEMEELFYIYEEKHATKHARCMKSHLFDRLTDTDRQSEMEYSAHWFVNDRLYTPTVRFLILLNKISAT
jgi:hypothetical protein